LYCIFAHVNTLLLIPEKPTNSALRKRSFLQSGKLQHHYHRRKGSYRFLGKSALQLVLTIAILSGIVFFINQYVIDIDQMMKALFSDLGLLQIFLVFFLSESFLGLLPPDLFIIWTKSADSPWLMVFILSIISYCGGIVSFLIGRYINGLPKVHKWLHTKYESSVLQFRKFGALVIFLGALTPLPFSPISMITGSLEYPISRYLLVALSRFARFAIYAWFLYRL
jgi:membrane protein YqaA with SNARE-associated domain